MESLVQKRRSKRSNSWITTDEEATAEEVEFYNQKHGWIKARLTLGKSATDTGG